MVNKIVGKVLDIAVALDLGTERNNDQSAPRSCIRGTHLRQVIGIQHQRMAGDKAERSFILLLRIHRVGRTELLDDAGVQTHTFLQLGGDNQTLALQLRHFRLHVALAADRQCIGGHIACIASQHTGDCVPEGRLTVSALTVSDDEGFDIHLSDHRHAYNALHIVDEIFVTAEDKVKGVLPDVCAHVVRRYCRHLRDVILRIMFLRAG